MPRPARAGRRRSSRTRAPISRRGRTAAHGRSPRPEPGRARSSTTRTATGSSPAGSAFTTAPSGSAAPSCRSRAATRRGRRSCSRISARRSSAARRATRSRSPTTSPSPGASSSAPASSAPSRGRRGYARRSRARSGSTALDIYGLSEVMGPGVSAECVEARDGAHVNEDHFLVEVVDPRHGRRRCRTARQASSSSRR